MWEVFFKKPNTLFVIKLYQTQNSTKKPMKYATWAFVNIMIKLNLLQAIEVWL